MGHRAQQARWTPASLGLGLLLLAAASPGQGKNAGLAGTWKLNVEKSVAADNSRGDSPDPEIKQGYSSGGRPRVGTGMTAPRGGGQPGGGGSGGGGGGIRVTGPLGLYARPLAELVIVQTDSTVTISDPSGTPRTYRTDGRKESESLPGSDSLEITAKWKEGKLITERKLGKYGTIKEVYSLETVNHELIVEVRLTGPSLSKPVEMRRAYDSSPGS